MGVLFDISCGHVRKCVMLSIMLCPLINYMSIVILYMYICSLTAYKMLLEKRQHSRKKELEV